MDYRVNTSKDLAANLAHAKAVISACRTGIPRIDIGTEDEAFIRMRIMRMISELETIDLIASKGSLTLKQRRANAKAKADQDRAFFGVHLGMYPSADYSAGSAVHSSNIELRDDTAVRKLA
ncbi:hypothetical protein [Paracoccus sp. PAMC 22219]|uniref:hypothetical protein n=1 Tax=Paracoccus sp. PAMC 22219 TaxID=1569209 RepID=UPI0005A8507F|nr:hypothetical protein [Paracoccus sp. PAMC 22219]